MIEEDIQKNQERLKGIRYIDFSSGDLTYILIEVILKEDKSKKY